MKDENRCCTTCRHFISCKDDLDFGYCRMAYEVATHQNELLNKDIRYAMRWVANWIIDNLFEGYLKGEDCPEYKECEEFHCEH